MILAYRNPGIQDRCRRFRLLASHRKRRIPLRSGRPSMSCQPPCFPQSERSARHHNLYPSLASAVLWPSFAKASRGTRQRNHQPSPVQQTASVIFNIPAVCGKFGVFKNCLHQHNAPLCKLTTKGELTPYLPYLLRRGICEVPS